MRRLLIIAAVLALAGPVGAQAVSIQGFGGVNTSEEHEGFAISVGAFAEFEGGLLAGFDAPVRGDGDIVVGIGRAIGAYDAVFYLGAARREQVQEGNGAVYAVSGNALGLTKGGVGVSRRFLSARWLTDGAEHVFQLGIRWAALNVPRPWNSVRPTDGG